jgi:hypothetical protein
MVGTSLTLLCPPYGFRTHRALSHSQSGHGLTTSYVVLFAAALMLSSAPAHAVVLDLSTMTCKQFVEGGDDTIKMVLTWMDGRHAGSRVGGTFPPVRSSITGDGILARSGTVSAKAMRCNARLAFVLWGGLGEERTASCGLERQPLVLATALALGCGQWAIRTDAIVAHPADREAIQLGGVLPCQQLPYQRSKSLRFSRRQRIQQ